MISLWVVIVPPTRNTQMRGPWDSTQARRLPGPLSLRLVTSITVPPRPPKLCAPNPSAPGKATTGAAAETEVGKTKVGMIRVGDGKTVTADEVTFSTVPIG